ncbi:hypothetical protein HYQ44_014040 [Verticillium longisporum]|nr:hypothetical protein HYQ44_014040 [Verticillium longisporum]
MPVSGLVQSVWPATPSRTGTAARRAAPAPTRLKNLILVSKKAARKSVATDEQESTDGLEQDVSMVLRRLRRVSSSGTLRGGHLGSLAASLVDWSIWPRKSNKPWNMVVNGIHANHVRLLALEALAGPMMFSSVPKGA